MTKSLEPGPLRDGIEFKINPDNVPKPAYRPVQLVSLGCHVEGAAPPHPDPTDPESVVIGQNRRVTFRPPLKKREVLRRLHRFHQRFLKKHFVPLPPDTNTSIEYWLSNAPYPEWRKQELRDAWAQIDGIVEKRHFIVNSFTKDETYGEYKNLRGINARTDAFKCAVGPTFKAIEKVVFSNPWFIKKVPVPDRPRYIYDLLAGENYDYYATDHTSFEGHFSKEFMEICEFELYDYMTAALPNHEDFMYLVRNVLGGMNNVKSKYFSYLIRATRMTGEMCTSLGNGYSNLIMLLFLAEESGVDISGVVEGDDSLFRVLRGTVLKVDLLSDLGFTLKIEKCDSINTASFCGNVFAVGDFNVITDPLQAMLSFGWTSATYQKSKVSKLKKLLRSKSLSLIYEYRGCPILKSLGYYGLRVTEGYRAESGRMNEYQREQLREQLKHMKEHGLPDVEIGIQTRLLFEELYGISVNAQIMFEKYLDGLTEIQPLDISLIDLRVHRHSIHYFVNYVRSVDRTTNLSEPNITDVSNIVWNSEYIDKINTGRRALIM